MKLKEKLQVEQHQFRTRRVKVHFG